MRPALLFILVLFILLSCKKSEPVSPGLFGKWELRRMYGGFAGFDSVYKAGNGRIFQLNSDSSYTQFNKGKAINEGTFHIRANAPGVTPVVEILFDNTISGEPFVFSGTSMTIGEDFDDSIASDYQKIAN